MTDVERATQTVSDERLVHELVVIRDNLSEQLIKVHHVLAAVGGHDVLHRDYSSAWFNQECTRCGRWVLEGYPFVRVQVPNGDMVYIHRECAVFPSIETKW
jgi:hypothetical protein